MIINSVNRSIEFVLGGAISTNQLPFVCQYCNTTREGLQHDNTALGISNNTTAVTILAAPGAGQKREIKSLSVYNADTASATVTVRLNDNATLRSIVVVTILTGEHLLFTTASGWFVLTAAGFIKSTSTAVNLDDLGDVVITSPATDGILIYNGTSWVDQAQANVVNGGTGRATATAYAVLCGGTTATGAHQSIAGVGTATQVLTSNGAGMLPTFQNASGTITLGTEQASTSGTSIDFTGIPAGVKRIKVMLIGVSTNGTSRIMVQIGDSGGIEATGYTTNIRDSTGAGGGGTTGFNITDDSAAAATYYGTMSLELEDSTDFTWTETVVASDSSGIGYYGSGNKSLSAELDRVRITTGNGTDAFDAGVINISYES